VLCEERRMIGGEEWLVVIIVLLLPIVAIGAAVLAYRWARRR